MNEQRIDILYEDNHLLVLNKPAELPTMGVQRDRASLVQLAKDYLKRKYAKPGNVFLGIVSRLDSFVSGAIVVARTSKAASRLSEQIRAGRIRKTYWALVSGVPDPAEGECTDWLRKNDQLHRMVVVPEGSPAAVQARLAYRTIRRTPHGTLLEVHLITGRKHQIRVQLAERGWSVVGDRKYGNTQVFSRGIALHSRRLEFQHPVKGTVIDITAPLPDYWPRQLRPED